MSLFFRNFVFATLLVIVAACAPSEMGDATGDSMMDEGMMMDMDAGYGVLMNSEPGEDQWASLEIKTVDSPDAAQEFMATNGFDRGLFDTNASDLYWGSENALKAQARFLAQNSEISLVIEGHADERGTDEYNLALGERRANAAREYLIAQGVDPSRVDVVTFGEERPVETCSDESCWAKNRRIVAVVKDSSSATTQEESEEAGEEFDF